MVRRDRSLHSVFLSSKNSGKQRIIFESAPGGCRHKSDFGRQNLKKDPDHIGFDVITVRATMQQSFPFDRLGNLWILELKEFGHDDNHRSVLTGNERTNQADKNELVYFRQ